MLADCDLTTQYLLYAHKNLDTYRCDVRPSIAKRIVRNRPTVVEESSLDQFPVTLTGS
ncbi:hypothetical protein FA15DRAFT_445690 [Coprinopsis marcescibilis]|uniref:Uncharacterized protein n=1 Tax=Coprinopsis marcescibilis TaxID=230819 RepID=A0A5C3KT53_COPMA|nr:hypothetical protein FA15DRAFT_445690 [Coprinopsis marcescibilis]